MASVIASDVERFELDRRGDERRFDHAAVDPRVRREFVARGYEALHTAADLGSSYTRLSLTGAGDRVRGELVPYSFYLKLAYMALVKGGATDLPSPQMANVGLVVVVEHDGAPCLLAQIKGRALDRGQLLAMTAAGKIDADELAAPEGLGPHGDGMHRRTLDRELREEIGLSLDAFDPTAFHYVVDEPEVGNVNHTCVARGVDLDATIGAFAAHNQAALRDHGDPAQLEVTSLALLPIDRPHPHPHPHPHGGGVLENIVAFTPTADDVEVTRGDYVGTVYTSAMLALLADAAQREKLLARAGGA